MPINSGLETIFTAEDVAAAVDRLARRFAPELGPNAVLIPLLQGASIFGADMSRVLWREGLNVSLDFLWLESYRDQRESSGRIVVRADLQRSVEGATVLILDDVYDTGRTLAFARDLVLAKGASRVFTCALVRKPAPGNIIREPVDAIGLDAPGDFLVGYGMDDAGRYRGLPSIARMV